MPNSVVGFLTARYFQRKIEYLQKNETLTIAADAGYRIIIDSISISAEGYNANNVVTIKRTDVSGDILWRWTGATYRAEFYASDGLVIAGTGQAVYIAVANGASDMNITISYYYLKM